MFVVCYLGEQALVFAGAGVNITIKISNLLAEESRKSILFFSDGIAEWDAVTKSNVSKLLKDALPDAPDQIDKIVDELLSNLEYPVVVNVHSFLSEIVISTVAILLIGHEMAKHENLRRITANYFSDVEKMTKIRIA
ncbi:hypothetical protein DSO57_1014877 [Entomophthora muscae]|uniref:Uncharacterized protein n=1 Tax=Entomophthora muscae TaxID=34485 RepID=A0ACC2TST3_9FUNG|nr:hypothetical protein DSO57_1014877 [Entomophthora muscae]